MSRQCQHEEITRLIEVFAESEEEAQRLLDMTYEGEVTAVIE